jgi:hypothetical protein
VAVVTSARSRWPPRGCALVGLPVPRVLVTPERLSRGKPDPEGYLLAAARARACAPAGASSRGRTRGRAGRPRGRHARRRHHHDARPGELDAHELAPSIAAVAVAGERRAR